MPASFLEKLISVADSEDVVYRIFEPVLCNLVYLIRWMSLTTDECREPLNLLSELCDMKIGNSRPICSAVGIIF